MTIPVAQPAPELQPAQNEFKTFVTQQVGFVGAVIAAVPVITDYLDGVPKPTPGKVLPSLVAVLAGTIFLLLFWTRQKLTRQIVPILGLLSIMVGSAALSTLIVSVSLSRGVELALYLFGFVALLGGVAALFVWGFVCTHERQLVLSQHAQALSVQDWKRLNECAEALLNARSLISESKLSGRAKLAIEMSYDHVIREYGTVMKNLANGKLEMRGPSMHELFRLAIEGLEREFRAISVDDFEYWTSEEASDYLAGNTRLLARNVAVERIFMLRQSDRLSDAHVDAIAKQIALGIRVSVAFADDCQTLANDIRNLDFGLYDGYAVSFWMRNVERTFRIETPPTVCEQHRTIYETVRERCVRIPGKPFGDDRVFENRQELTAWLSSRASA